MITKEANLVPKTYLFKGFTKQIKTGSGWMKNKLIVILLVMLFAAGAMAALPEVTQVAYSPSPAIPGSTITVIVQLENNETTAQNGISVQLENTYPFTVKTTDSETNPKLVGNIDKSSKAIATFIVYVDPTAENKSYSIPVLVTGSNSQIGTKKDFPILVSGNEPQIKVVSIVEEKLLPGEEKQIQFQLQNVGTSPAYDVVIEIPEDRTITATGSVVEREITPLGAAADFVGTINPGEKITATLKVSVSNTATIKNYTLPVDVSYRNATGTRTTDKSYIGLKVFSTVDMDATLKDQTSNGSTDITIEIFNKGLGKAEFTVVELLTEDGTIIKPKQFIGSLGPNDVDTVKTGINFNSAGTHAVQVKITYLDADAITKTKEIAIQVTSKDTVTEGPNILLILVIIIVAGFLFWNFALKKKK